MKKNLLLWLFLSILSWKGNGQAPYEKLSLDKGWRFFKGDIPFPTVKGHRESYNNAKAANALGAASANFNDKTWQSITLPHDWAVEGEFDKNENVSQGYRKRGIGWYRRQFKLDATDKGKYIEIQFDGIATHATIWLNGILIHRNFCGYTSMYLDITALAKYGDEVNTLAVRVDADTQEGWWYEGAGIYRHTWLLKRSPLHVATDGVYAQPVKYENTWKLPVEITLENSGASTTNANIEVSVLDTQGKRLASQSTQNEVGILKKGVVNLNLSVDNPTLWTLENPYLYQVKTIVKQANVIVDSVVTNCGFRTIRFDADSGFFLNEKNIKIQGVCNHQDHAGVGVAVPESIIEFRLRKLKEMGVNAYRCSHHPPSVEFLDLCDKMGIMVMDENRNFNISSEYMNQLRWMVRRDRNHPSIILWSVFNEEPMQGSEQGYEMVRRMNAEVKSLDNTRPVTAAMNGGLFASKNVSQAVDVVGFNYQMQSYDRFHKENPTMKLTSSEDVSAFQVRGEYKTDKAKNIMDAYDSERAIWGATHRNAWKAIAERPFLAGAFVWTGFDYRGEPTPFTWPSASSFFGAMDLCGFPKTAFYIHQAQWIKDKPIINIAPHWNWVDSLGKSIKVMVMSNADSLKLLLNGKMIAGQKVDKYDMNTFSVPFQKGKLEAVGYKNGKEVSRTKVETSDEPFAVQLIPDRLFLNADGQDAMPITVKVIDKKGREVPTAQNLIQFKIKGSGKIIGVGNGNPNSHELEKVNQRSLFNGLAQVIIQADEDTNTIELVASTEGLKPFSLRIPLRKATIMPYVKVINPVIELNEWHISAFSDNKPNPTQEIAENDMNSWLPTKSSQLQAFTEGKYALLRTSFSLNDNLKNRKLVFKNLIGKAEFWLDNQLIFKKDTHESTTISIPFNGQNKNYKLVVLIETEKNQRAGLGGLVTIE
ncbi:beta-galactosidase GalA [Arcicella sp. DC2W]|uniref:Beta-galactosidase GalA n=1 Tax=Arcicella gelida TaxID=2984195 RepID=A0ABU5S884_9BACT|nr:beta-galactosidase GalA [Arcicella sp. DC2W]MEA5404625.1 beta-galactosidase GalA [Arcicella sp. DC2W]